MKPAPSILHPSFTRTIIFLVLAWTLQALTVDAAGPFTVTSTTDTHVSNVTSGTDANGNVTLRSAIEAANADGGATINVPAGIYSLTLGELDVAPAGGQTTVIQTTSGATSANTFILQTDGNNRVFNIDSSSSGGTRVTLSGFTIQGGHDRADSLGGAGILAGSVTNVNKDALTLAGCVIQNNGCVQPSTNYTANPGGGLQMAGGDLTITSCVFSNNSSASAFGGAIFFYNQSVAASLNITNSVFANNVMTNNSGSGPDGGGAIMIGSTAGSTHNFSGDSFIGNKAIGSAGNTLGGAIQMNGGTLNVTQSTFISNSATGAGAQGGALYADSGTFNLSFCRFVGNSATNGGNAIFNHNNNGTSMVANNNWWNSNAGPGTNDLTGAATTAYLMLTHYATPELIQTNSSTALTASVITNSAGAAIPAANLAVLIGLPIAFNGAVKGTITSAQTTIQPSGTATAIFSSSTIPGPASANATVDNVTATAAISIQCPSITATLSGGGGVICIGGSSTVTAILTGGVSPYTVTLNNGGGTKTGASPLLIPVSPGSNTTYSISLATDADGCTAASSGSATVTVNPLPVATITPNPATVCGNSAGNTASGPAGMSGYGWSISNGTLTGSANAQTISYVPGTSGTVTLGLTVTNSSGCVSNSSINVPITLQPVATITANPPVVAANSPDNQATGPYGMNGYAWTITNGFITGGSNTQFLTYVAGSEGNVELGLTVTNASGCTSNGSLLVPITLASTPPAGWSFRTNYFASITFTNGLGSTTTMPMAFDGTNYWSCSGGGAAGVRLAQYDTNGNLLATYSPGLDFRSVFTDSSGNVFARQYDDPTIYIQTSPGVFVPSGVVLNGGALNIQSSVVLDGTGMSYIAMSSGVVTRWDADGNLLGTVNLKGFGSVSGENNNYQNRGIAAFGNFWLTYNGAGIVSVWDTFGNRLTTSVLSGAGTSTESGWSFCGCNGKIFVADSFSGFWRGYDVGSSGQVAIYGAPGTASWNNDVQSKILGTESLLKADVYNVSGTNPVPSLTNLIQYESVLVYSDLGFSSSSNLGNALASYVSGGGGAVVATFGLSSGLGVQGGILTNGDLPFTEGAQTNSSGQTLVEDVPTSQIFSGVTSFNGGSSSYRNLVTLTNSGTQIGHWSGGLPLIATRDALPGRVVGLNFYPPSSDARSDFWTSTTSGGALMANSLLWAGKVPPIIVIGPTNVIASAGAKASFSVGAAGLPPLTYQWFKNGSVIPGATRNALAFNSQIGSNGLYTVVVSNVYGIAVSEIGTLNSPVQFLPVGLSANGTLSLRLAASDGSALTPYRASRITVYSSANLSSSFATWVPLTNPMVLSNGIVLVQGLTVANSGMYFRASEAP